MSARQRNSALSSAISRCFAVWWSASCDAFTSLDALSRGRIQDADSNSRLITYPFPENSQLMDAMFSIPEPPVTRSAPVYRDRLLRTTTSKEISSDHDPESSAVLRWSHQR